MVGNAFFQLVVAGVSVLSFPLLWYMLRRKGVDPVEILGASYWGILLAIVVFGLIAFVPAGSDATALLAVMTIVGLAALVYSLLREIDAIMHLLDFVQYR